MGQPESDICLICNCMKEDTNHVLICQDERMQTKYKNVIDDSNMFLRDRVGFHRLVIIQNTRLSKMDFVFDKHKHCELNLIPFKCHFVH